MVAKSYNLKETHSTSKQLIFHHDDHFAQHFTQQQVTSQPSTGQDIGNCDSQATSLVKQAKALCFLQAFEESADWALLSSFCDD